MIKSPRSGKKIKNRMAVNGKPASNGKGASSSLLVENAEQLIFNDSIISRSAFFKNILDAPRRSLDADCQYPSSISLSQYKEMYLRNPFGRRVCRVWSSECWRVWPEVYEVEDVDETPFEKAWKKLQVKCNIYHFLKLVDELSGIGHYGVLFLGVDDGQPLDTPIRTINERGERVEGEEPVKLVYLRAFDEELAEIESYETDLTNPRYGLPTEYKITFDNVDTKERLGKTLPVDREMLVHWSRVVHIAPDCTTSLVWGTPRQEAVFNNLLDIRKILGGSAEMFWKGAFPGWSFETHPDAINNSELDEESVKKQVERWESGLQRYFASLGLTVKSLAPQVSDPTNHLDVQIQAVTTAMEIPKRVFLGAEVGELASSQDKATWNDRVHAKQEDHTSPVVCRPAIERFIIIGALPFIEPEEVKVFWPDLNAPSGKDKADVGAKLTDALYKYVIGEVYKIIPPAQFFSVVLKFDVSEINAIIESAMASAEDTNEDDPMVIVEEERLQQQQEEERQKFQMQKELTQVKQRKTGEVRPDRERMLPTNNVRDVTTNAWHKKRRKKKRKAVLSK